MIKNNALLLLYSPSNQLADKITKHTRKQGHLNKNKQKYKIPEMGSQRLQILELLETEEKMAKCIISKEIKNKPENLCMK